MAVSFSPTTAPPVRHRRAAQSLSSSPGRRYSPAAILVAIYALLLPLLGGGRRGELIPVLRPSEGLLLAITGAAAVLALRSYLQGHRWRFTPKPLDWWMLAFAVFSSIVPLLWLFARVEPVDFSLILAASPIVKYLILYLVARMSVRTETEAQLVMWAMVAGGLFLFVIALAENAGIGPVRSFLNSFAGAPTEDFGRAFTTLGSAIASGAVMSIASALAFSKGIARSSPPWLFVTGLLFGGAILTGQASAVLGAIVALTCVAMHHRVLAKTVVFGAPFMLILGVLAVPIVQERLTQTAAGSIFPQSWVIRWANLSKLYFPELADGGWLLGVTPETVLLPPDTWRTEVFIESGYVWALWIGGVPLLLAMLGMLIAGWRAFGQSSARLDANAMRIATRGTIAFIAIFSIIDPHTSLRGGADMLYLLLGAGLWAAPLTRRDEQRYAIANLLRSPGGMVSPTARLQVGEIGGPLLRGNGWPDVDPVPGKDRGIDIAVSDRGVVIAAARLFFDQPGSRCHGMLLHPVMAASPAAAALAWRAIALCADSMRLSSLRVPAGSPPRQAMTRSDLRTMAVEAERLERARRRDDEPSAASSRSTARTPAAIRLTLNAGISWRRRMIDIAIAGSVLVATAPVFVVIAGLIRRTSPGPALFRQMRIGEGGRPFQILKFRSMDNAAGPDIHREFGEAALATGTDDVKITNDARITPIGSFIRRTSLDELPQLINVVRGQMTLVGPRPSLIWETSLFPPASRRRLTMVPGIAGLWQARGRGDLSTEEMLVLDLEYVANASGMHDTKVMVSTAKAVLTGSGAR